MNRTLTSLALAVALSVPGLLPGGAGTASAAAWDHDRPGTAWPVMRAGVRADQNDAQLGVEAGRIKPLGKVLRGVHARYPGQLLDAQLVDVGGRPVYLIKLMTPDGNVGIVSADAATGDILDYRQGGR